MEGSRPFLLGGISTWRVWLLMEDRLKAERPLEALTARSEAEEGRRNWKVSSRSSDQPSLNKELILTFIYEPPDIDDAPENPWVDRRGCRALVSFLS
jgi:hypothetical protein